MRFTYKGHIYKLVLRKHVIPVVIMELIPKLYEAPTDYHLTINGKKLEGKVALITGAHRGIGFHIAMRLLKEGARVIITGRNEKALKEGVMKLNSPNVGYLVWDITDTKEIEHFDEAEKLFGKIDILVNNAGVTSNTKVRYSFEEMNDEHYHYVHDINTLFTRRMCIEYSRRSRKGTILNIISNTGILPALDAYFTSKWALYSFTKAFSDELEGQGGSITINGLCPGPIMSNMTAEETFYRKEIPNHRIGIPEEIAELAFVQIYSGINGQNGEITVCDGGQIYR